MGTPDNSGHSEADTTWASRFDWTSVRPYLFWFLFALPGFYHVQILAYTFAARFTYGFDLEWMEGGMLVHAYRIASGLPIYQAPSVDFVPYLYTPLYPAVLALVSPIVEVSYQTGRAVSILSFVVIAALTLAAAWREASTDRRPPALAAACLAVGGMASVYPWTEGWYDIARSDTMLCAVVIAGAFGLRETLRDASRTDEWRRLDVAGWAALLASAFFIKQTGIFFVAGGGAALLLLNWRALPAYVIAAGVVGLGGTLLLSWTTDGWFWTYIFEYHQRHPTSPELFWKAFGAIWNHLPVVVVIVTTSFVVTVAVRLFGLDDHRSLEATIFWGVMTLAATLAAATGRTTRWAGFNGYMPLIFIGHLTMAVGLVGIGRCARLWRSSLDWVITTACLTVLGMHLTRHTWSPSTFIPSEKDRKAGAKLLDRLRDIDGDLLTLPFPWYARLAGSDPHLHRMGIKDTTRLSPARCNEGARRERLICPALPPEGRQVAGMPEALREARFEAVLLGYQDRLRNEMPDYRLVARFNAATLPGQPTGYDVGRLGLWRRETPRALPAHGEMIFDFESSELEGWTLEGRAWGDGPVTSTLRRQQPVGGYGGARFMNSYHGGDPSTGTATSPSFTLDKPYLHLRVGGGDKPDRVRVELRNMSGDVLRTATGPQSEMMREVRWDIRQWQGQEVRLVLVDRDSGGWGHLTVDDVWMGEE